MEEQTSAAIANSPTALAQLGTLAIHYGLSLVGAIVLLIVGWILSGIISRWAYKGLARIHGIDETLARFFENVLHYGLLIVVLVMVLGQFGVQTASIVAALGAAGLAIGLALQGTLQNIAAGIMLLVLRPFRLGDFIETAALKGKVIEVGLFATELRNTDGLYLLAPNSTLWNTPIINHSREPERRQEVAVAVANDADINLVKHIMSEIISADPRVQKNPPPRVVIEDIAGEKVTVKAEYWAETAQWTETRFDVVERVKTRLTERGITIK
ncbi:MULTISPECIES: mechanosensitive ion channel domain-containing protein [unclassified Rhizobium]|uniref:mechanosensitive ion channel family protein n=1 Tax=unclassified Rhizobium TaxID=2613769 RepID=UPI0006F2416F|nr:MULTISPECIES: mechanosensitive ion channel domain-containing protein [unclassified Rhizobium]KQV40559.1 mechanosensitive ion channel protein [Rhizobium sp. Root1212]KRD35604.1 mechanosensitive ion channel protein [Rhizobium sp. Root268]